MKKNYSFYSLLTALPLGLLLLVGFTGGQGGNYSGSPGDANNNCTACHSPGSTHGGTPILTGVPMDYVAGTTYNLTLSINGSSVNKFGFNITAEDQNNTKVGNWTAGTGSQARNGGLGNGLTHSASNSSSWSFSWRAPNNNVGPVTFYYSTIQANGASGNSGDQMLAGSSAPVLSNGTDLSISSFNMFPTEADDILNINLNQLEKGQLEIYNMNGALLKEVSLQQENELYVADLSAGIYIANVAVNGSVTTARFIKK
ncbi:MAG: choice-of-anchor V domain-containing protein [Nonlabens sp.]|uniref:choice-of-anchor V domain-containing protein n=1 Tax=Nonlabens sp. TaxID=1888209 RepID=UPI003EF3013A